MLVLLTRRSARLRSRQTLAYLAHNCSPRSVYRLISICLGVQCSPFVNRPAQVLGNIGQAHLRSINQSDLIEYLLSAKNMRNSQTADVRTTPSPTLSKKATHVSELTPAALSNSRFQSLLNLVLEFVAAESVGLVKDMLGASPTSGFNVRSDVIRVVGSVVIIGYALISLSDERNCPTRRDVQNAMNLLNIALKEYAAIEKSRLIQQNGILTLFRDCLGPIRDFCHSRSSFANGLIATAKDFNQELWRVFLIDSSSTKDDLDLDLDDGLDSQNSHSRAKEFLNLARNEISAAADILAFQVTTCAKISYLAVLGQELDDDSILESSSNGSISGFLTSLQPPDFLACRPFIQELLDENLIDRDGAASLFDYLTDKIISKYDLERCEVGMGGCLDIMSGSAELWITPLSDEDDLADSGAILYEWFIKIVLHHGIASSHALSCMSIMLQQVIKLRPDYGRSLSLPSARTSLFRVLHVGDLNVKYDMSKRISDIFGYFILKEHDNILGDVIGNLPNLVSWKDGIAMRLVILARLASAWSTLLRRSVYAIIETQSHAPDSTQHARACLTYISKSLGVGNVQDLLALFAPQIVYTWLLNQTLESLPFAIFGYDSVHGLLRALQDDLVSQIAMRGRDQETKWIADHLGQPFEQLLGVSFAKTAAYCIAKDITIAPPKESQSPGAEARLRKWVGKENYSSLMATSFASIVTVFYQSMDQEELIEKAFQKRTAHAKSHKAYQRMMSISASEETLPPNQQPSFRARGVIDECDHLCRRTRYEIESMWSPALYIFVFRNLVDCIHPALGSLHACSVLRRIRILISMAGKSALELYPLEMALHSLRQFMTDSHCAEDAIGIAQYLLEYGATYLKQVPSFLAGFAVTTLTKMKAFLNTTQESTTQESQFKVVMSKAESFHVWLAAYLSNYASPILSRDSEDCFKSIMIAARSVSAVGNARNGTYESDLLLQILQDQRSKHPLLDQPAQDLILSLLCASFEPPPSFRDDILGSDAQATLLAPVLWRCCQNIQLEDAFLLWTGRVLGRAYASTGTVHHNILTEIIDHSNVGRTSRVSEKAPLNSRGIILTLLYDLVLDNDPSKVSMAEKTLRLILSKAVEAHDLADCRQVLATSFVDSMLWGQYICPTDSLVVEKWPSIQQCSAYDGAKTASKWAQDLCIALASTAKDDYLLSEIRETFVSMESLAETCFPQVLHLVLLKEFDSHQTTEIVISDAFRQSFKKTNENTSGQARIIINALLYLRKQPLPHESVKADRNRWLEVDYKQGAEAAVKCSMFKTALLFLELGQSEVARASRRASADKLIEEPTDLLLQIFQSIGEPDSYYGVEQPANLSSLMARMEYENAGFKSLSFRGAHYDSQIGLARNADQEDAKRMVSVLDALNFNGLSQAMLDNISTADHRSLDSMLKTARKLEQWDLPAPPSHKSGVGTLFRVFQGINKVSTAESLAQQLNNGILESMKAMLGDTVGGSERYTISQTLAVLVEADEVLSSRNTDQLKEAWMRLKTRDQWMLSGRYTVTF